MPDPLPIDARHLTPESIAAKLSEFERRIAAVEKREAAVERVIDRVVTHSTPNPETP